MSNTESAEPDLTAANYQARDYQSFRAMARRYMEARYGPSVWFRAPETFDNMLERWIWSLASGSVQFAEDVMRSIEEHISLDDTAV